MSIMGSGGGGNGGSSIMDKILQEQLMKKMQGGQPGQGLGGIGANQQPQEQGGSTMGHMAQNLGGAIGGPIGAGLSGLGMAGNTLSDIVQAPPKMLGSLMTGASAGLKGIGGQMMSHQNDMRALLHDQMQKQGGIGGVAGAAPGIPLSEPAGHKEPDADEIGGKSDNDADNKFDVNAEHNALQTAMRNQASPYTAPIPQTPPPQASGDVLRDPATKMSMDEQDKLKKKKAMYGGGF